MRPPPQSPALRRGARQLARLTWPALPAAAAAWVIAGAALLPRHALAGVHSYTGNGYDDGVYLGAAIRVLHGSLPWLDQDLLHPPGVVWLGLPFAALGELTSAEVGLAAARLLTAVVAGLNVILAGLVVRGRGPLAVFVTASLLALLPTSYAATQTFLLEPYAVLFSLAGLAALTTGDGRIVTGRRLVLAGALVGVAVSVKVFALLVAIAVAFALIPRWRMVRDWSLGVAAALLVTVLPWAVTAPGRFAHDVVLVQLRRGDTASGPGFLDRLPVLLGIEEVSDPGATSRAGWLLGALVLVVVVGLAVEWRRGRLTRLSVVVTLAATVTFLGMARPRQVFDHYAYFLVAIMVLPVGLAATALADGAAALLARRPVGRAGPAVVAVAGMTLLGLLLVPRAATRAYDYTSASADPGPLIRSFVPHGSCVATDLTTVLLVADRLDGPRRCDTPLDAYGVWLADNDYTSPHQATAFQPELVGRWTAWLAEADYVVLSVERSNFVPWTPALTAWFDANYVLVASGPDTFVYYRLPGR